VAQAPSVAANVNDISENTPQETFSPEGAFVGQALAVDPDDEAEGFEWAIDGDNLDVDGDGNDAFAIDGEGEITVNDPDDLDFEEQESFTFNVEATEVGVADPLTGQTEVTVGLRDRAEALGTSLNVDGGSVNGDPTDALTDGILTFRYLQGTPADLLTQGDVLADDAERTEGQGIFDFLRTAEDQWLNVDGGSVNDDPTDALTDGLQIFRYLQGTPADLLTQGNVLADNAERTEGQEIFDFLQGVDPAV
jgi:hypothetical protein